MSDLPNGNGRIAAAALKLSMALCTAAIIGLSTWTYMVATQLEGLGGDLRGLSRQMETRFEAVDRQLTGLQSGLTTPMAAETRAHFDSMKLRIDELKQSLDRLLEARHR